MWLCAASTAITTKRDSLGRLAKELGYAGINNDNVVDVGGAGALGKALLVRRRPFKLSISVDN